MYCIFIFPFLVVAYNKMASSVRNYLSSTNQTKACLEISSSSVISQGFHDQELKSSSFLRSQLKTKTKEDCLIVWMVIQSGIKIKTAAVGF